MVTRTQHSGPLCLWQCFVTDAGFFKEVLIIFRYRQTDKHFFVTDAGFFKKVLIYDYRQTDKHFFVTDAGFFK